MAYDFEKICRICLNEGELNTLFTNGALPPSTMIMMCTEVKITKTDGLPAIICNDCINRLDIAFQFKQQCENSDNQLRQYLNDIINKKDIHNSLENFYNGPIVKDEDIIYDAVNEVCEILSDKLEKFNDDDIQHKEYKTNLTTDEIISNDYVSAHMVQNKLHSMEKISNSKSKPEKKTFKIGRKRKKLSKPDVCSECGKTFNCSGYLAAHIRTHTGEKPYECDVCNKKFGQLGNLAMHLRTHTGEKPFQCEVCSKQFATSSNLYAHQKSHISVRNFNCNECSQAFKTATELARHSGTHTTEKNQICQFCNKPFSKKSYLNVHIRTVHNGEKKYKCSECGKSFSYSSNLRSHFRTHTGEKPFSCHFCDTQFNQSSSLTRHMRHHHIYYN